MRRAGGAAAMLLLAAVAVPARGGETIAAAPAAASAPSVPFALSLDGLEGRVDSAPGLLAVRSEVAAATADARLEHAKNGLIYEASNSLGPRSDIVIDGINNSTLRYTQRVGVRVPLLGERLAIAAGIDTADRNVLLGDIDVAKDRRDRLTALRTAYVHFWQAQRQVQIARGFFQQERRLQPMAHALRRGGYWTAGNFADYLDILGRARRDVAMLGQLRRAAFADIQSALGSPLTFGEALDPNLRLACVPARDALVADAIERDPESLAYRAKIDDVDKQLLLVKHSTVEASAGASVGAIFDIPRGVGYDLSAGVDLSVPQHMRLQESAHTDQLAALRTSFEQLGEQRRVELGASVERALADYAAAVDDESAARREVAARREDVREVKARNDDLEIAPKIAFADLENQMQELYAAEREQERATGDVLLAGVEIFGVAPHACRATPAYLTF